MPDNCPVCESARVERFLHRPCVPVHQNLLMATGEEARAISRGDLEMAVCRDCGFAFNAAFDLGLLRYGASYDNDQACSAVFREHLEGLVARLVGACGVRGCRIVDVGCGGGDFLRRLVTAPGADNTGVGFDPAYEGPDVDCAGRIRFERRYYGPECAGTPADVVVCRHVIEHVPRPVELLTAVRQALTGSPSARVFFETPDVSWILRNQVVWDLFYEHCSLFTRESLATAFQAAGFAVERVETVFGGQYLWLEARVADRGPTDSYVGRLSVESRTRHSADHATSRARDNTAIKPSISSGMPAGAAASAASDIIADARQFAASERAIVRRWRARLAQLAARGPVAIWGAGAKGVTFANLADPDMQYIDCVADLNPHKQGKFLPGTAHPIVDHRMLPARGISAAIVMNPNYLRENRALVDAAGFSLDLIGHDEL